MNDAVAELDDLERVMDALAHAARRHILLVIHTRGGAMTAGDIAARFSHSWPTTSRHLRVLEEAGLVTVTEVGRTREYHLNAARLDVVRRWLGWFDSGEAAAR